MITLILSENMSVWSKWQEKGFIPGISGKNIFLSGAQNKTNMP